MYNFSLLTNKQLDTLKATVNRSSSDLEALRKNISKIKKDINEETTR